MSREICFVQVGNGKHDRVRIDSLICDVRRAAVTLAGLEVAIAKAPRKSGTGKCLHCGALNRTSPEVADRFQRKDAIRCCYCGGVLTPLPAREGEGQT